MAKILKFLLSLLLLIGSACNAFADNQILRIPLHSSEISLDPGYIQDISSLLVSRQINCQLVRNESGVYKLEAAKSVKYLTPLQIQITLNDGIKFNDGSPVTSDDVIASFNYLKNSRVVLRSIFSWISNIKSLNSKTLLITLTKPIPQFLMALSAPNYAIFKKDFINKAIKDRTLWNNPVGCGGYKITEYEKGKYIDLKPNEKGIPVRFYFNDSNQIEASDVDKYDIISLGVAGNANELDKFKKIQILDPSQIYIGLNANIRPWNNKSNRCAFFSKLDPKIILNKYNDQAVAANDFFPQGAFGYDSQENYFSKTIELNHNKKLPELNKFCLSFLVVSITGEYQSAYKQMLNNLYPNIDTKYISNSKDFGLTFKNQQCDALVFGYKSNYLDGYEYLDIFLNKESNFSGYDDKNLSKQIESSQGIVDSNQRSNYYRNIVNKIENECLIRPLITVPMKTIYVRNTLATPHIGLVPFNEYYLGNVVQYENNS